MAEIQPAAIRVLVADDEEAILDLYEETLVNGIGSEDSAPNNQASDAESEEKLILPYELTRCSRGDEAIEAVRNAVEENRPFAMAFLDVLMPPGSDGIQAIAEIRKLDPEIQIVIVTACLNLDIRDIENRVPPPNRLLYVQKPFQSIEIRQFASTLAARWHTEREAQQLTRDLEQKIRERTDDLMQLNEELRREHDILSAITRVQSRFISETDISQLFDSILTEILEISQSEFGVIGEALQDDDGTLYLKAHALTNIAWNTETRALYESQGPSGYEIHNLDNLIGATIRSEAAVIANHPASDPRAGGLPPGHPPLEAFLGLPLIKAGEVVGMVGMANRHGGYSEEIVGYLNPLLGTVANLITAARVVEARQQAEDKRRESEQRLRTLVDHAPETIVLFDADTGRFVDANDNAMRLYGLDHAELLEVGPLEMSPPNQPDGTPSVVMAKDMTERALQGETPVFEWTHRNAQGKDIACEVRLVRLPASDQKLIRGSVTDITDRKQAEAALRESRTLLESTIESTADGILVVDATGKVIHTNRRFGELWRIPDKLINGGDDDELLAFVLDQLEDPQAFLAKVRELYKSTREDLDTLRFKDGRIFERYSRPLLRDGEASGRVWSFRDITERHQHQAELARARRLETAGQLAGQIAHDFNNLLSPMAVYPEMARSNLEPDSPVHRMLDIMENCANQMADINQQLLTLSRRGHYKIEPLDLNQIVDETLVTCNLPAATALQKNLDSDLLPFRGGKAQVQRVLVNLLSNANEAIDGVGEIRVETENIYLDYPLSRYSLIKKGEYIRLQVTDNGSGIPAEAIDRIFDPFFSTKSADKHRGTGLGLSVVHSVMEDHDGYIDLESVLGHGTTISLYFPIFRGEATSAETPDEIPHGSGQHVLVVDDDPIQRQVAGDALTQLGYKVTTAVSGEEAVVLTLEEDYDVVILDMVMDGIDGVETLRRIQVTRPEQIAVMLSGFAANDRVEEAMALGAKDFLAKPVRIPILAGALRKALTESAQILDSVKD
jgi:PAS domain S-box-containing protein